MMKWRVRRDSQSSSNTEQEDVRRSIEVLDDVLAQFDDCFDSWDYKKCDIDTINSKASSQILITEDTFSGYSYSVDGSTKCNNFTWEQPPVSTPPPVPRRNPTTQLSDNRNHNRFSFAGDDISLEQYKNALSPPQVISSLSDTQNALCNSCGRLLDDEAYSTFSQGATFMYQSDESSRFADDEMSGSVELCPFIDVVCQEQDCICKDTIIRLKEEFSETLKLLRLNRINLDVKLPSFLPPPPPIKKPPRSSKESPASTVKDPNSKTSHRRFDGKEPSKTNNAIVNSHRHSRMSDSNKMTDLNSSGRKPSKTNSHHCQTSSPTKITDLNSSDGGQSSRTCSRNHSGMGDPNKITNFNSSCGEPSRTNSYHSEVEFPNKTTNRRYSDNSRQPETTNRRHSTNKEPNNHGSYYSLQEITNNTDQSSPRLTKHLNWKTASDSRLADVVPTSELGKRSSSSFSSHLSETIEDLPKLLPTDALNRPHLGLSYSLEDDLSPGIKEIRTSTPKSAFRTKENLFTFNHSNSSLGYVSSQSDLELNVLPVLPDKVPMSTFRSRTLPNGLERSPFYSPEDDYPSFYSDRGCYGDTPHQRSLTTQEDLRSCSVPLPPDSGKTRKKHFRGFSRKDKKSNKKGEDNLSLNSDLSYDDRIILKALDPVDGSTMYSNPASVKMNSGGESKKRSVWKSIIRKKTP